MRRAKVDRNHAAIVRALRDIGCSVQSLATVGDGCPDLLVGYHGVNHLLEVKDGSKPPSARQLTPDEGRWHTEWRGDVVVVSDVDSAIGVVTHDLSVEKRNWSAEEGARRRARCLHRKRVREKGVLFCEECGVTL